MAGYFEMASMLLYEGSLELLEALDERKECRFGDFQELINTRTAKKFSSNTLSARIKELRKLGLVEYTMIALPKDRQLLGYRLTARGKQALAASRRYENELQTIVGKK